MRLPRWDELSSDEEQLAVLEAPLDEPLFVVGPPGSGKTSLAVWRGDALAELHGKTPVVTYNRMLRRSLQLVADADGIDIHAWTMQSFVGKDYGRRMRTLAPKIPGDRYALHWQSMIGQLTGTAPDTEALVVDEGQDLPSEFFVYVSRFVARTMSVFADEEQAISASRSTLEEIRSAAGLPDPIILSENHRNTPEIARLAEHFHRGRLPTASVTRPSSGDLPGLVRSPSEESTARRIANELRNRSGSVGVIVSRDTTGQSVHRLLEEHLPSSRIDRYSYLLTNEDSIDVRSTGITVLNKESVKGQEFDTVFILELDQFIPCTSDAEFRAMYMMCTRARDRLFLVHGPRPLSTSAQAALPRNDILER